MNAPLPTTGTVVDVRDGSTRSRVLIALAALKGNEAMTVAQIRDALGFSPSNVNQLYQHLAAHHAAGRVLRHKHTGLHGGKGYVWSYRLAEHVVLFDIEFAVQTASVMEVIQA
jgi:predicted transcriptional regulator